MLSRKGCTGDLSAGLGDLDRLGVDLVFFSLAESRLFRVGRNAATDIFVAAASPVPSRKGGLSTTITVVVIAGRFGQVRGTPMIMTPRRTTRAGSVDTTRTGQWDSLRKVNRWSASSINPPKTVSPGPAGARDPDSTRRKAGWTSW